MISSSTVKTMLPAMMKMLIMMKDFSYSFHSMVSMFVIWTHLECCVPSYSPLCTQYIQTPTPCSLCTLCIVVMHTAETSRLTGQHGALAMRKTHLTLKTRFPLTYSQLLSYRFEILYRARQYHCRALHKFSKRFDDWNGCSVRTRFHESWV